jgi:hypothetical protein
MYKAAAAAGALGNIFNSLHATITTGYYTQTHSLGRQNYIYILYAELASIPRAAIIAAFATLSFASNRNSAE